MPNGSLDKWLHSNNQYLDILQRLNIMIYVASALEYLHHDNATPVVHCDLKPNNVLLDKDMVAHLSDFGITKLLCEEVSMIQTMTIATFGYMAPEVIDFTSNNLTGHIPKDMFDHLPNLKGLYWSLNLLSGRIPASLFKCKELQVLALSYNQMEGSLPIEIGNLSLLQDIAIGRNHFEGIIPREIGNLKNLNWLDLDFNNLTGSIPPHVFNISTLRMIALDINQLSGHLPSNMGLLLPNMEQLYLASNHLVGSNFLFDSNPFISGELPRVVGNVSSSLEEFSAYSCNIRGSIPNEIGNLSHLISIDLGGNKLIGQIPTTIGGLEELQSLSLKDNKLEGSIPSQLCHLNKLAFLFLTNNKLSGPIPACLGDLTSLRQLFLDSNKFSSSIPSTLTRLNYLLILYLSSNSLSGPLPTDIGKWKVLTSLDLSNNQFSGDIPTGVADLKDLTHFSLSNNRIMGSIPESFDELLSLEFLDLSRNNLSGEIPKSLKKLRYLKYFNVSFNRLEGKIPEGGSFGNYTIESFKGNEALCGATRLHVPNCKTRPLRNSKAKTKLKLIIYVALPIASTILVVALIIIILQNRRKDKLPTQEDMIPLGTWRRFSYHELRQATDGFNGSRLLGNGSYGSLFQGTLQDGTVIAVKVFKLELEGAFKSFDVECDVLCNTRHRNLVKVISSCSNDLNFKALVLEFMPNGSLDKWLYSNNQYLDILQRLNIMIDVASALEYLHHGNATPVVHCDLKPNNVLLDEDMVAHLSDFGIAKLLREEVSMIQTMTMATFGYMAPEYGIEGIVSTKGDVYSFGILLMEIITRKKPTDKMFEGERSLNSWVIESISSSRNQVVDPKLLSTIGREHLKVKNCALSILQVGLECSAELPNERLHMKEVVTKLKKIKVKLSRDMQRVR
ncbi:receptor kinase-like protein Xa21 [Gossypium raimondii]|uniref:receptor kinase-like protein Xa21 n=1 Tax=Gossypium raimondii TaxID=29730 RepID=UPI00227A0D74|nr:receptor kinase-like protein Xa21 [Gossypium raimondii]